MLVFTVFFENQRDEFSDEFCFCRSFSSRRRPVTNFGTLLALSFRFLVVLGSS